MDNLYQRKNTSASERTKLVDSEREHLLRQVGEKRHCEETLTTTNDRSSAIERKRAQNKARKDKKRRARSDARYDYERRNFTRDSRRDHFRSHSRRWPISPRRVSPPPRRVSPRRSPPRRRFDNMSSIRMHDKRIDSLRLYNDSHNSSPRRTLSESREITSSESIRFHVNTQFASSLYLNKANINSVYLEDPSPKLLILDLNGTLVYRDNGKKDIILRPYINRFLQYIFESNRFVVMVWSSAQPYNVDKMVRAAFNSYEKKLIAKWTRKNFNLSNKDYHQKVETVKDLEKVWKEFNNNTTTTNSTTTTTTTNNNNNNNNYNYSTNSSSQIVWDQTNTILIDDSCVKAKLQPYNAIHLPDFDYERWKGRNDRELKNVIEYLGVLHKQSNVSAYIKEYPYIPETKIMV